MLAQIHDLGGGKLIKIALLTLVATTLVSCVHEDPQLIADPSGNHENALPWNEQQKWERNGSAAGLNTEGRR